MRKLLRDSMVTSVCTPVNLARAVASADTTGTAAGSLAELAARPLFVPLASLLRVLPPDLPGAIEPLNERLDMLRQRPGTDAALAALRFVQPDDSPLGYEARIQSHGEIVTRPCNWHDFFNALVWMRFPRTKLTLNALHVDGMAMKGSAGRRGPVRDAATQFDESGVVVASADPALLALLQARRWQELFWNRRGEVLACMRFLVFGHGLYDALRAPFYRICGRAALVQVEQALIDAGSDAQCERLDAVLAARFAGRDWYPRPKVLLALPLLGIPGAYAGNECAQYYADTEQFRPPPA